MHYWQKCACYRLYRVIVTHLVSRLWHWEESATKKLQIGLADIHNWHVRIKMVKLHLNRRSTVMVISAYSNLIITAINIYPVYDLSRCWNMNKKEFSKKLDIQTSLSTDQQIGIHYTECTTLPQRTTTGLTADWLCALSEVWPTWTASPMRSSPERPAAVAAGDDEDVGTGIDSGAVSKGSSGTVTIWSSLQRLTPDCTPNLDWLTPSAVLEKPEWQRFRRLMNGPWPDK